MGKGTILGSLFKKDKDPKVTVMLMDVAEDFVSAPDDIDDRRFHLELACMAWNIACEDSPTVRSGILNEFLKNFKGHYTRQSLKNLKTDLQRLIKKKIELYPLDKLIIVKSWIEPEGENDRVSIATLSSKGRPSKSRLPI